MYEFEIKRSRSDFLADFKNKESKHRFLKERRVSQISDEWKNGKKTGETVEHILIPNRYFFVCKEGLIKPDELPEYAGLIYVDNFKMAEISPAKLLHKMKANIHIYDRIATVLSQRIIYGCSYYTYRQKLNQLNLLTP